MGRAQFASMGAGTGSRRVFVSSEQSRARVDVAKHAVNLEQVLCERAHLCNLDKLSVALRKASGN
jgi:hypothetical protein